MDKVTGIARQKNKHINVNVNVSLRRNQNVTDQGTNILRKTKHIAVNSNMNQHWLVVGDEGVFEIASCCGVHPRWTKDYIRISFRIICLS